MALLDKPRQASARLQSCSVVPDQRHLLSAPAYLMMVRRPRNHNTGGGFAKKSTCPQSAQANVYNPVMDLSLQKMNRS